ncbi:MAG: MFS transporter [Cycloclasticus sp.]|nr:MAG: MFS transporter [Cycloclasticus sp.]
MATPTLPYWRLSSVYFFYFASLGILMPYLGLYLKSLGFVAAQVGLVFAVIQGTKIVAPNIWAWIADTYQYRMRLVQVAALLSAVTFSFISFDNTLWTILIVCCVFSFFWNAMLPQFEAVTLTLLADNTNRYSKIRLWGSVGFIVAVAGGGALLERLGVASWPMVTLVTLGFVFAASLFVRNSSRSVKHKEQRPLGAMLKEKKVLAFFAMLFLIQASHGPYYSFFSILLKEQGYSETAIGQFWSLGVVAEILLFLIMQRVFRYVSLRKILLISIVLTIVRWLLIAWFSDNLGSLLVAQILHAASFGAFHVACIQLIHTYFKGVHQVRGQALYSSVGFGAGGMFGSLMAGYMWDSLGPTWAFSSAAFLSACALFVAYKWLDIYQPDNKSVSETGLFQS